MAHGNHFKWSMAAMAVVLVGAVGLHAALTTPSGSGSADEAEIQCEQFVEDVLAGLPRPFFSNVTAERTSDDTTLWRVSGHSDVTRGHDPFSLGGHFTCIVRNNEDSWSVISFTGLD